MPAAELKKKLIELFQTRNKPYGIIVRKWIFRPPRSVEEARRYFPARRAAHPVSTPILVYKVFPDGHEELVRGLRFRGFTGTIAQGHPGGGRRQRQVWNSWKTARPSPCSAAAGFTTEVCVIAPSIIDRRSGTASGGGGDAEAAGGAALRIW